jgi:hypothetical protein
LLHDTDTVSEQERQRHKSITLNERGGKRHITNRPIDAASPMGQVVAHKLCADTCILFAGTLLVFLPKRTK